jgi:hypothetical protein
MQALWQISIHLRVQIFLFFLIFCAEYDIMVATKVKETENERDSFPRSGASTAFVVSTK